MQINQQLGIDTGPPLRSISNVFRSEFLELSFVEPPHTSTCPSERIHEPSVYFDCNLCVYYGGVTQRPADCPR